MRLKLSGVGSAVAEVKHVSHNKLPIYQGRECKMQHNWKASEYCRKCKHSLAPAKKTKKTKHPL